MRFLRATSRTEAYFQIRERLKNKDGLLRGIGAILVSTSQASFEAQRLGEVAWPGRYPGMTGDFINIAGVISDLRQGGSVKARRLKRRPALSDTGKLQQSIAFQLSGSDAVEAGSDLDYADIQHSGGKSRQRVTSGVKAGLRKYLGTKKRPGKGYRFRDKLGWMLNRTLNVQELVTDVTARPFVGVTAEAEEDIVEATEMHIADNAAPRVWRD